MEKKPLLQQKTFWSGLAMIGYGLFLAIPTHFANGVTEIIGGISIIFGRQAIENAAK